MAIGLARKMNLTLSLPVREVQGEKWCSLQYMGVKRLDIVAYSVHAKQRHTFAGGHRHKFITVRDDIHILFPDGTIKVPLDIEGVRPATPPRRRHGQ
jgi:hypothetical protein